MKCFRIVLPLLVLILVAASPGEKGLIPVGVATIDTTPGAAIRLSGYGSRKTPSEGVGQKLRARALAIGEGTKEEPLSVLITVDAIGIPAWMTEEVANRLEKKGVKREQFAIAASHTHTGPSIRGMIPYMLPTGFTDEERRTVDHYSETLVDKLEQVSLDAIAARKPSRLSWGKGELTFAANRRVLENGEWKGFGVQPEAPLDHSMPILRVTDETGRNLAVLVNYACHCTTLGGDFNQIHADWAGEAQAEIERRHPETTAMIAIGCGADMNPEPRGEMEAVVAHGNAVADEVDRMLGNALTNLSSAPSGIFKEIELPLDELPEREEWEKQVEEKARNHHFPQALLEKLDRGEELATSVTMPIQTWTFGDDLAMVFLGGEVVVDYAHRLYRQFDAERLWINAYSNDVPCYITSRRIYEEGGYEVDGSRYYYGIPARLRPDTEDRVCDEVLRQLPHEFYSDETLAVMPAPIEVESAVATITVADGHTVELAAGEPQTMDPVDIAWDSHDRMWVVEMADYPTGIDGEPGGRIRVLDDTDGDGFYETSSLFLDGLKYPNSIFPWRDGVIFVTADSIRFARDTDGDNQADENEALFTGFESGNSQHQLGSLKWGLDNWIHVGNGDSKGKLVSAITGESIELGARDARFDPDTGAVEALSGKAQFGLTRDDWGNWFGSNNSRPWWHYALDDRYLARNPHVTSPDPKVMLTDEPIAGPVFPASKTIARFNDYDKKSRFTSACGLHASGDFLYVAEPVHNLVSRIKIEPDGTTFTGARIPSESNSEFFASTDNWSRPTVIRTGPDGALYVVDMYRQVIEHPEWIPDEWQRRLVLRSGHDRGRIYRVAKNDAPAKQQLPVAELSGIDLANALDSPNSNRRDQAHLELIWRDDSDALKQVSLLLSESKSPQTRIHALAVLDKKEALTSQQITAALVDPHTQVRRHAIRVAERHLKQEAILRALYDLSDDENPFVRQQLAYSLGESSDERSGKALSRLLAREDNDAYLEAAILSSVPPHLETVIESDVFSHLTDRSVDSLLRTALGMGNETAVASILDTIPENLDSLARISKLLEQTGTPLAKLHGADRFLALVTEARETAVDADAATQERRKAIQVLGKSDTDLLLSLLDAREPNDVQMAAVQRGTQLGTTTMAEGLLDDWSSFGTQTREIALTAFLERSNWTALFLEAAGEDSTLASTLDATQRASLLNHRDPGIRNSAATVLGDNASSRSDAIARFEEALELDADTARGGALFASLCATCHKIGETGFHVGPDLTALTNLSRESLLTAIVDPQAAVESKYAMYVAETTDGRSISGIIASETASGVTLLGAGGLEQSVPRSQLESLNSPGISLMPEGLEAALDPQKMADLLGYLQKTGASPAIQPDEDGSIRLTASLGSSSGGSVALDPSSDAFNWIGAGDILSWEIAELPAGTYSIFFDSGTTPTLENATGKSVLSLGGRDIAGIVEPSRSLTGFKKRLFGEIRLAEKMENIRVEFRHEFPEDQIAIREIVLAPR